MKTIPQIILLFLLALSCKSQEEASVKNNSSTVDSVEVSDVDIQQMADSINKIVRDEIYNIISHVDSVKFKFEEHTAYSKKSLIESYKLDDYYPLWKSSKNRADAIDAIERAYEHGLLPKDYHLEQIANLNNKFYDLETKEYAELDLLLTDAIILYGYHLVKGKIKPHDLSFSWNFIERDLPPSTKKLMLSALKDESLDKALFSLEPQDDEYKLLKEHLKKNKDIIENGAWRKLGFSKVIHPGDSLSEISLLRDRMIAENYLSESDTSSSNVYDAKLLLAVEKFQLLHGLNSDGVIGNNTLRALNMSAEDNQKKIICNLERRRWIKFPEDKPYIKVNIASFKLNFIEGDTLVYDSHVVVGKAHKETPLFMDELRYIVINPTWTLPFSITSTETLGKLKRDPNYLQKHNMNLIDSKGNIVSCEGIDWSKYKTGHFPYMVRQEPGPSNALGRVKFMFPNKYAIYLHDTPSKSLFAREERAFSHGCIRLQNPLTFAEFLLKRENEEMWDTAVIDSIVKTSKLTSISLKHRYPVLLMYQTAGETPEGELYYYHDIYNRDEKLYNLLSVEM